MNLTKIQTPIGIVYAVIAFISFSLMDATARFALTKNLINFQTYFLFVKCFCVLIMLIIGIKFYKKQFFTITNKKIVFLRSIVLLVNSLTATLSVKFLALDIFYSLVFIMPILAIFFGIIILDETVSFIKIIALISGFIGVIIIINPNLSNPIELIGVILALTTAITGALSGIITRKYLKNENPYSTSFYALLLSFIIAILINLNTSVESFSLQSVKHIPILLLAACFTVIGTLFYMKAYQVAEAKYVAPIQYSQLIWGILLGFLLFHDKPNYNTLIGATTIIASTLLGLYKFKKDKI